MSQHKHRWTPEEEQALHAGVEKYGTGKWKEIIKDPLYSAILVDRSNIDLKDKWRNIHAAVTGSRSRGKVKTLATEKTTNHRSASSPLPLAVMSPFEYGGGSCFKYGGGSRTEYGGGCTEYCGGSRSKSIEYHNGSHIVHGGSPHIELGGSSGNKKPPRRYKEMIVEALASPEDPNGNGLNVDAICNSIEQKYELQKNYRNSLTSILRRLVRRGVLEKVGRCYKFKDNHNKEDAVLAAAETEEKIASDAEPAAAAETEEKIASTAADLVVEAENKRLAAIKAFEKAEKLSELLEESKEMLKMAEEIYEQCERMGHVLLVN